MTKKLYRVIRQHYSLEIAEIIEPNTIIWVHTIRTSIFGSQIGKCQRTYQHLGNHFSPTGRDFKINMDHLEEIPQGPRNHPVFQD